MKKAERLNQELIYLSYRDKFHLKDLEEKFKISERTALRDITDLEDMGLKFYVERGRYGAYKLIKTKLWIPIRFNFKEINAIFFAIKALERMSATPFSNEYQKIYQKLLKSLPPKSMEEIQIQQMRVNYRQQPSLHKVKYFDILLQAAVENLVLEIENEQYVKGMQKIQVYELFYQTGNWFCQIYNLDLKKFYILRCDKIFKCKIIDTEKNFDHLELEYLLEKYNRKYYDVAFKCEITKHGCEIFSLNKYPTMKIESDGKKYFLSGKINHREINYLTDYLLRFGVELNKIVKPMELKKSYLKKLKEMQEKIN